jgi:hypothetical protein
MSKQFGAAANVENRRWIRRLQQQGRVILIG